MTAPGTTPIAGAAAIQSRQVRWLLAAVLALATFMVFWPAIHNNFTNYDDTEYVTANAQVQGGLSWANLKWAFTHPVSCNWHPLTMLSHMLDCQLYGLQSAGHHLTSVLFHALNAALVFLLLNRLTGSTGRSFWVAALFALHPLRVESVAWVAERKDVLSGFFGLLALLCYARYAKGPLTPKPAPRGGKSGDRPWFRSGFYWLACACFALGLLSKPMLVTWPFLLCVLDFWPLNRFQTGSKSVPLRGLILEKIPFLGLAALASAVTMEVQTRALAPLPLGTRGENAIASYCRYLGKIFWPENLSVFYPYAHPWPASWLVLGGAFLATITALAWLAGRRAPYLSTGWFWFIGTLVPVIGIVQVGEQSMADRYTYLPSIGAGIAIVWGIYALIGRERQLIFIASAIGGIALVLGCVQTRRQIAFWQDGEHLFRHAIAVNKDNAQAHNNLGAALYSRGETNAAISEFQMAVCLKPNFPQAHNNLGTVLVMQGQNDAALAEFRQAAVGADPDALMNLGNLSAVMGFTDEAETNLLLAVHYRPGNQLARRNLAHLYFIEGRINDAVGQFKTVIQFKTNSAADSMSVGNFLIAGGQTNAAIEYYQDAIRLQPDDADTHYLLANLLTTIGRADDAIAEYQTAIRLRPDFSDACDNLGSVCLKARRMDEAIHAFQDAVGLAPDNVSARYNLGLALESQQRMDEAIEQFQAVIRLNPNHAAAYNRLGIAFGAKGQFDDAIAQFQHALELRPDYTEAQNNLALAQSLKKSAGSR